MSGPAKDDWGTNESVTAGKLNSEADAINAAIVAAEESSDITALATTVSGKQASDADLTAVAALTPANNDVLQRKSGAWTNRTMAQLKTDLNLSGTNTGDGVIYPEAFGAVGDGTTDDQTALTACFAAAAGKVVWLNAAKSYKHSDILQITVDGLTVTGGGTLLASDETQSALQVSGDYVTLRGIVVEIASTTTRGDQPEQHGLYLTGGHFLAEDVFINKSAAAGVMIYGASDFTLRRVRVDNTRADGIQCTHAATRGLIEGCTADSVGDDGFSVVSYEDNGTPCSDIVNTDFRVINGGARGISVVGGSQISYYNGRVDGCVAAAVYVACEESFESLGVADVTVDGVSISGANNAAPDPQTGAVLVYNSRSSSFVVERVSLRNFMITDTDVDASRQFGIIQNVLDADNIRTVTISNAKFAGTEPGSRFSAYQVDASGYNVDPEVLGSAVVGTDTTQTLTKKRLTPRVGTTASSATPAINTDSFDQFNITALAVAITSMTTGLTGTPTDGQKLLIRIEDNGTARAIAWGASFVSSGVATLLATTVLGKTHHVLLVWDAAVSKWVCLAVDAVGY